MLTDAGALALALVALRLAARPAKGALTYGLKRTEILSAQFNGATLLVLGLLIVYEGIRRLIEPPEVEGGIVLVVALVGVAVNVVATVVLHGADRTSLNVEGAFQHVLTDLVAFIATAIAGAVVLLTGFDRADGIASLFVAAVMLRAAWSLLRDSGRIFLEAAPKRHRRGRGGRRDDRRGRRHRGPRPARLGGHLGLPGAVRARAGRHRGRLPPGADGPGGRAARPLRDRAHDAPGRPRGRRSAEIELPSAPPPPAAR